MLLHRFTLFWGKARVKLRVPLTPSAVRVMFSLPFVRSLASSSNSSARNCLLIGR